MFRSILFTALYVLASIAATAQEKREKKAFDLLGTRQGWAVEAAAGTMFRPSFLGNLSVSKQLTPVIGLGVQIGLVQEKDGLYNKDGSPYGNYKTTGWYLLPSLNVLVNFSNLISGYKPNHLYNAIFAIGGGFYAGGYDWMSTVYHSYGVTLDFALQNQFRITDYLRASVNISGLMGLYRFGASSVTPPNCSPACTVGLVYCFSTR